MNNLLSYAFYSIAAIAGFTEAMCCILPIILLVPCR